MTRTITLEEHYASRAFLEGPGRGFKAQAESLGFARVLEQLCDLEEGRIADMDAAGIDVQVLSLTSPGVEQLDATEAVALAREENDRIAETVRRHPGRFAGFAALPTPAPDTAADELERMVREHGFEGALINGHTRGRYLGMVAGRFHLGLEIPPRTFHEGQGGVVLFQRNRPHLRSPCLVLCSDNALLPQNLSSWLASGS